MTSLSDMPGRSDLAVRSSINEEKAAWYREVLDLEPGSKVFVPFARLLLELDRADEAIDVLRDGLERHPEFMEARLLLIDVLHRRGDAGCGAEVARLAGLFRSHPDFWDAWGAESASTELAVSLGFLAALFRNEGLTLADVLAAGLDVLREQPFTPGERAVPPARAISAELCGRDAAGSAGPARASSDLSGDPPHPRISDGLANTASVSAPAGGQDKCSLRTRSMAEVLAEQGDVRGAVDIYEELLTTCRPEDRASLEARLDSLRERLGTEGGGAPLPRASASAPARSVPSARNGMLDLLERLAVRLETKARQ
ncbi:MAG: tetratricopeptide repeat protein [Desulfovibrionaceae bacterium]|nr:tetratricopeptide repeat protein [Desulfovibrionaceae bacterium]